MISSVQIVKLEKFLNLLLGHRIISQLMNISMTEIDHVLVQGGREHLVVDVLGVLGQGEEGILTDVVFEVKVAPGVVHSLVVKWIVAREKSTREGLIAELRRVVQALHHVCLLSLMTEHSPRPLILVDKG